MSNNSNSATGVSEKKEKYLDKVIPTLFIGVGGTGAEVLWRVRRRILSRVWTGGPQAVRLESLDQFPFTEFLHVDLDFNTVTETGRSSDDPLQSAITFKPSERFVKKLDLSKYIGTDEDLRSFPLVEEWFPLSAQRVRDLNINPEKGAGQIRSISRLYFFDQYEAIKGAIKLALSNLRNNVDNEDKHKQLGLTLEPGALRVVVVASTAGGTGSGASIDMGYLSKILLKQSGATGATSTQLVLMLPTGYVGANAARTQANTYSALMELEACMRGGATHIGRWSKSKENSDVPRSPYDDVYFLDTENLAGSKTNAATACFEMAADVLFEDFSTADFANKKRSISVNQNQHKVTPYASRIDRKKYGDMKLTFSRAYSAFGQAILDTQLEQKQSMVVERQVSRMLGVFFGVSAEDDSTQPTQSTEPTDADRDELLERLQLGFANEVISYDFASTHDKFRKGAECTTAPMAIELLRVGARIRLEDIERGIDQAFNEVKMSGDHKEWPRKLTDLLKQIRRDAIKTVDAGTGMHEEGVEKRRAEMRRALLDTNATEGVVRALWSRVDNKEMGGLDFSIALIQRMKDRLENADTGLVKRFDEASRWFSDLSGFIDNTEIATLKDHLNQAVGKWVGGKSQTEAKWLQLAQAAKAFVRYHLMAVACREAAVLVGELSKDLGHKTGTDAAGNPVWTGFIGELERGRQSVQQLMGKSQQRIKHTSEAMKQKHEMYQVLPAPDSGMDDLAALPAVKAREWADQVFKDLGGTQALFSALGDPQKSAELVGKLRNQALSHIADKNTERGQGTEENPLFAALDALTPGERQRRLEQVMQRAMPWAALRLDGYLKENSPEDQYKCFIGVKDSAAFARRYGKYMTDAIPTSSKMTAFQVGFVEISEPGRLVCYVELSGVPAPSLTALSDWYANYRSENEIIPVHTHKRLGNFVHARELSHTELADRKADLELMIQALALGDLQRSTRSGSDGALICKIGGVNKAVGGEKTLRLNGFDTEKLRVDINEKVQDSLAALRTPDQHALWWALIDYYKAEVYPTRVVRGDDNVDRDEMHLPTLVCTELLAKALDKLEKSVGEKGARSQLQKRAKAQLRDWTETIIDSEADPYRHEVNQPQDDENGGAGGPQPKRVLKMEVFDPAWRLTGPVIAQPSAQPASPAAGTPAMPPAVHPVMGVPGMPLPPPLHAWHLSVAGQNYGPFQMPALQGMLLSGQFNVATLVWREGMATWVPAASLPELALLLSPLPSTAMPPPLPPPHLQ